MYKLGCDVLLDQKIFFPALERSKQNLQRNTDVKQKTGMRLDLIDFICKAPESPSLLQNIPLYL